MDTNWDSVTCDRGRTADRPTHVSLEGHVDDLEFGDALVGGDDGVALERITLFPERGPADGMGVVVEGRVEGDDEGGDGTERRKTDRAPSGTTAADAREPRSGEPAND
ncbi:hypothetical protein ACFO0N_10795 [Halobium salinum]|uniref:Uncharacterized protein n=1 Tax=Halobium salinum TaxID=1364940 RepID=A0ABD5PCC0_9EURY|nr:hypothetical protein [Halobium salinum]